MGSYLTINGSNMRTIKFFLFWLVVIALIPSAGLAQDITQNTYTWKASQVIDGRTSSTKASTTEFVTHASNSVDWIQRNGELKTAFVVTGIKGNWPNIHKSGSITYLLEYEKHSCTLRLERGGSGLLITMDFGDGVGLGRLTFKVDSVR